MDMSAAGLDNDCTQFKLFHKPGEGLGSIAEGGSIIKATFTLNYVLQIPVMLFKLHPPPSILQFFH